MNPLCNQNVSDHGSSTSQANVNHVCEADANVKPLCGNDVSDHVANLSPHVLVDKDVYQTLQKGGPDVSDLTTKAISPQGVSMGIHQIPSWVSSRPVQLRLYLPLRVKVSVLVPQYKVQYF